MPQIRSKQICFWQINKAGIIIELEQSWQHVQHPRTTNSKWPKESWSMARHVKVSADCSWQVTSGIHPIQYPERTQRAFFSMWSVPAASSRLISTCTAAVCSSKQQLRLRSHLLLLMLTVSVRGVSSWRLQLVMFVRRPPYSESVRHHPMLHRIFCCSQIQARRIAIAPFCSLLFLALWYFTP